VSELSVGMTDEKERTKKMGKEIRNIRSPTTMARRFILQGGGKSIPRCQKILWGKGGKRLPNQQGYDSFVKEKVDPGWRKYCLSQFGSRVENQNRWGGPYKRGWSPKEGGGR